MTNNDVLRRVRYALSLSNAELVRLAALGGVTVSETEVTAYTGKEDEPGAIKCPEAVLAAVLDGLIIDRRGPPTTPAPPSSGPLTNNAVMKKLRIALTLQEPDVLAILEAGGHTMSKGELTALFRKPEHKHYRACGNQILRKFLVGLTTRMRTAP